uniref:Secreted protein n=1 Tax=Panagrolaimus davidi TaxID=227884 RepID=A0A914QZ31_9BILA
MSSHIITIILFLTIALTLAKPQQQIHAGSETPTTVVEKTEVGLVEVPKTVPEGAGVQSDGWPIPEGTVHEP